MSGVTWSSSVAPRKKPSRSGTVLDDRRRRPRARRRRRGRRTTRPGRGARAVMSGPISEAGSVPGPTTSLSRRRRIASISGSPTSPTATTTRHRHAPLAGRPVGRAHRGVGGQVEVGVGEHDHVVLGAAERLHPLPVGGARLVDVARHRGGADEADRRDVGVLEQPVHRHLVAVHDVEHAVGQPGLAEDLGEEHAGAGVALGRLEHDGVAAGDGVREHPERHHAREVERGDAARPRRPAAAASARRRRSRPAARSSPFRSSGTPQANSMHSRPRCTSPAASASVLPCCAVMTAARSASRRSSSSCVDAEEELGALGQRPPAPDGRRVLRRRDRVIDLLGRGEAHLARLFARRGVVDRSRAARLARRRLPGDPMPDQLQLRRHGCVHHCLPRLLALVVVAYRDPDAGRHRPAHANLRAHDHSALDLVALRERDSHPFVEGRQLDRDRARGCDPRPPPSDCAGRR